MTFKRRTGFGLSRELWLIEAGILLNMLGYGAVLPFEVIYLHNGRGFGLGVTGLIVGTLGGAAVVAAGPRTQAAGSVQADAPAGQFPLSRRAASSAAQRCWLAGAAMAWRRRRSGDC